MFFHTPGMYLTTKENTMIMRTKIINPEFTQYHMHIIHEVYNMLDFFNEKCLHFTENNNKDLCARKDLEDLGKKHC